MVDHDRFLFALRAFAAAMARDYDTSDMCFELCERVTEVLGADGAGVAVADRDGALRFVTATSDRIVRMEQAQEHLRGGPCRSAFETRQRVVISELATLDDWPAYLTAADEAGMHAVVGQPLVIGPRCVGALNVYHAEPRAWTDDELSTIGVFADMATAYLVRMSELQEATQFSEQLQRALDSRVVIEQAKGMIANRHGISVDRAFGVLRAHARNNNLRLAALAEAVVNMGLEVPAGRE